MSPEGKRVIHYTEVVDPPSDWILFPEWKTFRAALLGLLADSHDGKFALVKGDEIMGFSRLWTRRSERAGNGI
jgi:hypothetical protein